MLDKIPKDINYKFCAFHLKKNLVKNFKMITSKIQTEANGCYLLKCSKGNFVLGFFREFKFHDFCIAYKDCIQLFIRYFGVLCLAIFLDFA